MNGLQDIPVGKIVAGDNDRKHFNKNELQGLADVIAEYGPDDWPSPPLYRPLPDGRYQIVAGERRTRAMRDILGWETIRAMVREMDDNMAAEIMLGENEARVNLNPMEQAQGYKRRIDELDWTVDHIAQTIGKSTVYVQHRLDLLNLAEDIQHLVRFGQYPYDYARQTCDLDVNRQRIALRVFNSASSMPMLRWRAILNKLRDEQAQENQQPLFVLELELVETVKTQRPVKGRKARTGAVANRDIPPVRHGKGDTMAPIFDQYIRDLQDAEMEDAAGAVANIYNLFVAKGWVTVTDNVILPKITDAKDVGKELHEAPRD